LYGSLLRKTRLRGDATVPAVRSAVERAEERLGEDCRRRARGV
jgi:hypothetical protein